MVRTLSQLTGARLLALPGLLLAFLILAVASPAQGQTAEKPKVRAVTAFVRIDRAQYRTQVSDALLMLRKAKAALEQAGYEVQSLRIATQPFGEYTAGATDEEVMAFFAEYAALSQREGFDASIGPALFAPNAPAREADLMANVLRVNSALNGSLTVADESGVRWNSVLAAARVMKFLEENTPGGAGNFNFSASAVVPPHTPFFPGAYHNGPGRRFALALQSANVVAESFRTSKNFAAARTVLEAALGSHAQAIESVAKKIDSETGWRYEGIDLSPAPLKDVSIGAAIENLTGAKFGSSGTMTAAAMLTGALQRIRVKHAGYSGLMVPVLEDTVLAQRWSEGVLTLDALLAYSAVCGTGLDTVPLPGDVTIEQLERIIGDMASLAVKWKKPLSARLMPVPGKSAGESSEFNDPFLVNAVLQRLP